MQERENSKPGVVWKLVLSYDGTEFHGWQIQPGWPTIQGTLADAIALVTGEQVLPQGSGRTDAGVHALGQVASFSLRAAIPANNLLRALNRILPAAIRILSAEPAADDFHARHSAVGKQYQYRIFHGGICPPFLARYVSVCRWPLNLEAMQAAANAVLGEHDFTSFAASDPDRTARLAADSTGCSSLTETGLVPHGGNVRRIDTSQWTRESFMPFPRNSESLLSGAHPERSGKRPGDDGGEILTYTVSGTGFLHHMVRNLVGTFIEVGRGRLEATEISRILASRDRSRAGPTAPPDGLCLIKVLY